MKEQTRLLVIALSVIVTLFTAALFAAMQHQRAARTSSAGMQRSPDITPVLPSESTQDVPPGLALPPIGHDAPPSEMPASVGDDVKARNWERYKREWQKFVEQGYQLPWDYPAMSDAEKEDWGTNVRAYIREQSMAWLRQSSQGNQGMGGNTVEDFQRFAPPKDRPF